MTDYKELVEALRCVGICQDCNECEAGRWHNEFDCCLFKDAAAAIEELQAQLPKLGEWEREMDVNDEPFYQCSVCGECFDFNRDSTHEVFKYCPNCGAKMGGME